MANRVVYVIATVQMLMVIVLSFFCIIISESIHKMELEIQKTNEKIEKVESGCRREVELLQSNVDFFLNGEWK